MESSLQKLDVNPCGSCEQTECVCEEPSTEATALHLPLAYTIIFVNNQEQVVFEDNYEAKKGEEHLLIPHLLEVLQTNEPRFRASLQQHPIPVLTPEEEKAFSEARLCHICDQPIAPHQISVRDHCHSSGAYLGNAPFVLFSLSLFRRGSPLK